MTLDEALRAFELIRCHLNHAAATPPALLPYIPNTKDGIETYRAHVHDVSSSANRKIELSYGDSINCRVRCAVPDVKGDLNSVVVKHTTCTGKTTISVAKDGDDEDGCNTYAVYIFHVEPSTETQEDLDRELSRSQWWSNLASLVGAKITIAEEVDQVGN